MNSHDKTQECGPSASYYEPKERTGRMTPAEVLIVLDAQARHTRQFGGSPSFQAIEATRAAVSALYDENAALIAKIKELRKKVSEIRQSLLPYT